MFHRSLRTLLVTTCILLLTTSALAQSNADHAALISFYGDVSPLPWNITEAPCRNNTSAYLGIRCSHGRVVSVVLPGARVKLVGSVNALCQLEMLQGVFMPLNALSGSLLPCWCNLKYLKTLQFTSNHLDGALPDCWSPASALAFVELAFNKFTGEIPPTFCLAATLESLRLAYNNLYGLIPDCFGVHAFPTLRTLDLSDNALGGYFSPLLCSLSSLTTLALSKNNLGGVLPPCIHLMVSLQWLDLAHNSFDGDWPASDLSLLDLRHVNLDFNRFTGSLLWLIPLNKAETLILSNNRFSGHLYLPDNAPFLQTFVVANNFLVGQLPSNLFADYPKLTSFVASNNRLSGSLPTTRTPYYRNSSLQLFSVQTNSIGETLPSALEHLTSMRELVLSDNRFKGPIDVIYSMHALERVNLDYNFFSGTLDSLNLLPQLREFTASTNRLYGRFPESLVPLLPRMTVLSLTYNTFTCSLPPALNNISSINANLSLDLLEGNYFACPTVEESEAFKGDCLRFELLSSLIVGAAAAVVFIFVSLFMFLRYRRLINANQRRAQYGLLASPHNDNDVVDDANDDDDSASASGDTWTNAYATQPSLDVSHTPTAATDSHSFDGGDTDELREGYPALQPGSVMDPRVWAFSRSLRHFFVHLLAALRRDRFPQEWSLLRRHWHLLEFALLLALVASASAIMICAILVPYYFYLLKTDPSSCPTPFALSAIVLNVGEDVSSTWVYLAIVMGLIVPLVIVFFSIAAVGLGHVGVPSLLKKQAYSNTLSRHAIILNPLPPLPIAHLENEAARRSAARYWLRDYFVSLYGHREIESLDIVHPGTQLLAKDETRSLSQRMLEWHRYGMENEASFAIIKFKHATTAKRCLHDHNLSRRRVACNLNITYCSVCHVLSTSIVHESMQSTAPQQGTRANHNNDIALDPLSTPLLEQVHGPGNGQRTNVSNTSDDSIDRPNTNISSSSGSSNIHIMENDDEEEEVPLSWLSDRVQSSAYRHTPLISRCRYTHMVHMRPAPLPIDIEWHHLDADPIGAWKRQIAAFLVTVVTILFMAFVNVGFVIAEDSPKVSDKYQPLLVVAFAALHELTAHKVLHRAIHLQQSLLREPSRRRHVQWFFRFSTLLHLFNSVLLPIFAQLVFSGDCLLFLWEKPSQPSVSVSYTTCLVENFQSPGCFKESDHTLTYTSDFIFRLSSNCAGSLEMKYAPVFLVAMFFRGFLLPALSMARRAISKYREPHRMQGTAEASAASSENSSVETETAATAPTDFNEDDVFHDSAGVTEPVLPSDLAAASELVQDIRETRRERARTRASTNGSSHSAPGRRTSSSSAIFAQEYAAVWQMEDKEANEPLDDNEMARRKELQHRLKSVTDVTTSEPSMNALPSLSYRAVMLHPPSQPSMPPQSVMAMSEHICVLAIILTVGVQAPYVALACVLSEWLRLCAAWNVTRFDKSMPDVLKSVLDIPQFVPMPFSCVAFVLFAVHTYIAFDVFIGQWPSTGLFFGLFVLDWLAFFAAMYYAGHHRQRPWPRLRMHDHETLVLAPSHSDPNIVHRLRINGVCMAHVDSVTRSDMEYLPPSAPDSSVV